MIVFSRWRFGFLFGLTVAVTAAPALAQQKASEGLQIRHSGLRATSGGAYTYIPGKWSILSVDAINSTDKAQEVLTTTYFDGSPTLQYGRRLWLPAKSRLHSWHPLLVPAVVEEGKTNLPMSSLVLDPDASSEVLVRENTGEFLQSTYLPMFQDRPVTGLIDTLEPSTDPVTSSVAYDLVAASRVGNRLSRVTVQFRDRLFAPDEASLETLQQLVITDSRVLDDPAGLAAVRRWLHGGGKLWVMLDRVDPEALELLLGDDLDCQVIDRVGLTTVRIEPASRTRGVPPIQIDYEVPVDLVRTVVSDVEVAYTVGGWPAAFWKSFGEGRLLVTTLGPRGWMRPKTDQDQQPGDSRWQSMWLPLDPMADLARDFYRTRPMSESATDVLETYLNEYVGYTIPSRELIVGFLAGLGALLVVGGLWLMKKHALEHLAWIGPTLSLCVAAALLAVGAVNRHEIPAMAASLEFVEAVPGSDDVRTQGAVVLYTPEEVPAQLSATRGGRLVPDMEGLEGRVRRMVWTDLDAWHWEHLSLRAGPRQARFTESRTSPARMEARGVLGPDGLTGTISAGGATGLGDALIATPDGRIGVTIAPDGNFSAPADAVLSKGQFLHSGLVTSDEQDRRRRIYERMLKLVVRSEGSSSPSVFLWSDPSDSGLRFGDDRRRLGASLVSIPLVLDRPPAGTSVRIPPPLIPYRNTAQPDGSQSSPLWDYRSREWAERDRPASAWLKFHLPRELLPIELTRALVTVDVTGPMGLFELMGLAREPDGESGRAVRIDLRRDPVGRLTFDIPPGEVLKLGSDGTLVLGLAAGDPERPELTHPPDQDGKPSYWTIEQLSLELWGRTDGNEE